MNHLLVLWMDIFNATLTKPNGHVHVYTGLGFRSGPAQNAEK